MSSEHLVRFEGVGKKFCKDLRRSMTYGIADIGREFLASRNEDCRLRKNEFWALQDAGFELRRGECLGLVGRNGAGKTTLLRLATGLIRPDTGAISRRGRLIALIALGAGFNPILTGRENIYVNAAVLGISRRDISARIDDIIDFAEIGDFIDAPVQSYSSGMQVRLGFAIATSMEPDVLLIDEVLAVGDAGFRAKCFQRIGELIANAAVMFVSHDRSQLLRICDKGLYLERGRIVAFDTIRNVVAQYEENLQPSLRETQTRLSADEIASVSLYSEAKEIRYGEVLRVWLDIECLRSVRNGISLISLTGIDGMAGQAEITGMVQEFKAGLNRMSFDLGPLHLRNGLYRLGISITDESNKRTRVHVFDGPEIRMESPRHVGLAYQIPAS